MTSLFCRHNRFTADCPICSKGTVLDSSRAAPRQRSASGGGGSTGTPAKRRRSDGAGARQVVGPYVGAGPYERDGDRYDVRLERVPGGVRMGEWARGMLQVAAPELRAADLPRMVAAARERSLLPERDLDALARALEASGPVPARPEGEGFGASEGRAGDLREQLRVEALAGGMLRVARWIYRPGERAWELQDAPTMLPAKRYAEAIADASRRGVLAGAAA